MQEATKFLELAKTGAEEQARAARGGRSRFIESEGSQFPAGLEWDILLADSTVLLGLTNALQESYMGLAKCL